LKAKFVENLSTGTPQHIVCYGCSLTAGGAWVEHLRCVLEKKYPNLATVTNSGCGGKWSKWGLDNLDTRVIQKSPNTVFIEFSMNDAFIEYETDVISAKKYLYSMIENISKSNTEIEIILMVMNPPTGEHLAKRPNFNEYNQMYRDVALETGLLLIDHQPNWESILKDGIEKYLEYVPDGIHPSPEGCKEIISPYLQRCLGII